MQLQVLRNPNLGVAKEGLVLVEKGVPAVPLICEKLEYWKHDKGRTFYREKAAGCLWVYLTDCKGGIVSGMQHVCVPGNILEVEGCHAFGCQC